MSLNVNDAGGSSGPSQSTRPLPTTGVRPARISQIVDLGVQPRKPYQGQEKSPIQQIFINLELVTDEYEYEGEKVRHRLGPKPFSFVSRSHKNYNNSAIADFLNGIDPKDSVKGDLAKLANRACLASIAHVDGFGQHVGKKFASITKVMEPPENYPVPELSAPAIVFSFDAPTAEAWNGIPKFLQEKIKLALNYPNSKVEALVKSLPVKA